MKIKQTYRFLLYFLLSLFSAILFSLLILLFFSDFRVTRSSLRAENERKNDRCARLSTSSSEIDSEVEKIREENNQIFSRLKGIVSDESD